MLKEMLFSAARGVKVEWTIVADIVAALARGPGVDAEGVVACFWQTQ
jgi:hypothetical protein